MLPHLLMLETGSLCPFEHTLLIFPRFPLLCKLSIEMEDWSNGGLGGGLGFFVSTRGCKSLSLLSMFIINRNIRFSSITCVWLWMFWSMVIIHGGFIYARAGLILYHISCLSSSLFLRVNCMYKRVGKAQQGSTIAVWNKVCSVSLSVSNICFSCKLKWIDLWCHSICCGLPQSIWIFSL